MAKAKSQKSNWLSIGQAAEYLGISRDTLRRWEKKDMLSPTRSPTNRRYYTQSILDEVMKKKQGKDIFIPGKEKGGKQRLQKISQKNLGISILAGFITLIVIFALAWLIFLR